MAMRIDVRADIKAMTRDLNHVQRRVVPTATARSLNEHNRKVRTRVISSVASHFKSKVTPVRRQIRTPKFMRANPRRLRTGAFASVYLPKALTGAAPGREVYFDAHEPRTVLGASRKFHATVKNKHDGVFIRLIPSVRWSKGRRETLRGGGRSTSPNLPIKEVYTDQSDLALRKSDDALVDLRGDWRATFTNRLRFLLESKGLS